MNKTKTKVVVIASGKGGVGKTTTTANLSATLAKTGLRVLAIDGDVGLRNLDIVMGLENRIVYTLCDYLEGNCKLEQAIVKDKRVKDLHLLPAAQTRNKDSVTGDEMYSLIEDLKGKYDFIFLDSPAGIETGFSNASIGADDAIVICTPEVSSVRDADRIVGMLEGQGKDSIKLIVNRYKANMVDRGDMLDINDILDILSIDLIGIVPEDENVVISTNKGEPLAMHSTGTAGQAFDKIGSRILGNEVPFDIPKEENPGFFSKLKGFFSVEPGGFDR